MNLSTNLFPQLGLDMAYLRQVNWSLIRTGFPFIHHFYLTNQDDDPCRIVVTFKVEGEGWQMGTLQQTINNLPPRKSFGQENIVLSWNYDLSFVFKVTVGGHLNVIIQQSWQAGRPDFRQEIELPVEVLSGKEWCCGVTSTPQNSGLGFFKKFPYYQIKCSLPQRDPRPMTTIGDLALTTEQSDLIACSVAALVFPDHPVVKKIELDTYGAIQLAAPSLRANPISYSGSSTGRIELAQHLYARFLHDYKFFHTIEEIGFEKWTQKIRLPEEIFKNGAPEAATCIDVVLVFCAALNRIGLSSLFVIFDNGDKTLHAIAACWIAPPSPPRKSILELKVIQTEATTLPPRILLVDATELAYGRDFNEAQAKALQALDEAINNHRFGFAIDLEATWNKVHPLPWHADPLIHAYRFDEKYLRQVKERIARDVAPEPESSVEAINPEAIYVPLKCRALDKDSPELFDVLEYIDTGIKNGAKKFAVLGNPGTGKSYFLGRLLLSKAKQYSKTPDTRPIPLLYPLNSLIPRGHSEILIQLKEHLRSFEYPDISLDEFRKRIKKEKFIFLLDALDELTMPAGSQVEDYLQHLRPLLEEPDIVVILTARSGLFAAQATQLLKGFRIVELERWDEKSWDDFLTQCEYHKVISHNEHNKFLSLTINSDSHLKSLITKPLFCRMLIETRELVFSNGVASEAELFHSYITKFLRRRHVHNDFLTEKQKIQCMERTAFYMEQKHRRILELEEISDLLNRKYPHLASRDDWQPYLLAIKVYGFLDNDLLRNSFYFSHEAFREFFLATKFLNDLFSADTFAQSSPHIVQQSQAWADFGQFEISLEVAKFMVQLLNLENDEMKKQAILSWTKRNMQNRRNRRLWHGGHPEVVMRNLVLIRALMSKECTGLELSSLNFSKLDLSSTNFAGSKFKSSLLIGSNLQNCSFAGADLTYADFSYCILTGADFRNANLAGTNFIGARMQGSSEMFSGAKNRDRAIL